MRGLFVTATDTGVGKTFVTAGIARIWRREQRSFRVCKPVATGAENGWGEDTRLLAAAADETNLAAVTPFTFIAPLAPPVAARREGAVLSLDALVEAVRRRAEGDTTVLVEGVGGLLCPLTERDSVAELARELDVPLIVVARLSLGTLNHTLLTVEAAQRRGLRLAGIVVTATTPDRGLAEESNPEELRRRLGVPILAVVPYHPAPVDGVVPVLAAVDWWRLSAEEQGASRR